MDRKRRLGLLTALIASAVVAIGAVAVAVNQEQTGTVMGGGGMSIGSTATTTTPPTVAPTAKAVPVMTATRPKGF